MLELHTTTANTFVISQAVSEAVGYTLGIEGLTLLKVESGGVNDDTHVYYFSNTIGHLLPYDDYDVPNFDVKLLFLRRESITVDERMTERNLFIGGIQQFVLSQVYTDAETCDTSFLDKLYEDVNHEVLAEFYLYKNVLYSSLEQLIENYLRHN